MIGSHLLDFLIIESLQDLHNKILLYLKKELLVDIVIYTFMESIVDNMDTNKLCDTQLVHHNNVDQVYWNVFDVRKFMFVVEATKASSLKLISLMLNCSVNLKLRTDR